MIKFTPGPRPAMQEHHRLALNAQVLRMGKKMLIQILKIGDERIVVRLFKAAQAPSGFIEDGVLQ